MYQKGRYLFFVDVRNTRENNNITPNLTRTIIVCTSSYRYSMQHEVSKHLCLFVLPTTKVRQTTETAAKSQEKASCFNTTSNELLNPITYSSTTPLPLRFLL